ncbi:MAG: 3-phosphoserine/phosphohydroxythreonine transaminase [Clostridiales Family XIII bacterium]|jgi:phosphoserine aminotransferase|nr:3-phosphoserine/phosphohydroxythreonine transaminase [Clostridiales Family XIII bacterium]
MGKRVYNFSAGPSMLPLDVLQKVAERITDYEGTGMSVMEMSHRSKAFDKIIGDAESNLRTLMNVPDNYHILFLQGGATLQFSMVPINLMNRNHKADFVVTGSFAGKAAEEGAKFGAARIVASSKESNFTYIPKLTVSDFDPEADYVHITYNNTIYGTRWPYIPDTGVVPLVADVSSCILSEEIDVSKFGLLYAGAQKNIAPSGLTVVIIRDDLVGNAPKNVPLYLDYEVQIKGRSMYNTPPTWSIYVAGEVFKLLLRDGGVPEKEKVNRRKAKKLYDYIDASRIYTAPAAAEDRSFMNAVFGTGNADLDEKFVAKAQGEGLIDIGGHRSVGGMRASIYNAMPEEGVDALIAFMRQFEDENI